MKVVRVILFVINVIAALGLWATTLAGVVAPSRWVWPSLLAFAFLPMLVVNLFFVVLWILLRRWTFLFPVAAIAVRWSVLPLVLQFHIGGGSRPDSEPGSQLSLMSYNVHQFRGNGADEVSGADVANGFLSLVREHQPQVLCMQEFAAVRGMNVTDSLTLMGYNHYYGAHNTSRGIPYGTVVFSRLPISFVRKVDDEKILVELVTDDGPVRLCALHLSSYRFDDADFQEIDRMRHGEVQQSSRRTLSKVKATIVSHEQEWQHRLLPLVSEASVPLIVSGDFNDIPNSYIHSELARYLDDAFCERGRGLSVTYSGGFPPFRIDWVLHSSQLQATSYRRLKSPLSDHYPVLVTLQRKGATDA